MPSRIICAYEDVIQVEAMCLRYLFSRLGQSIVAPQKLSGGQFQAQCNILTVIKESRKLLLAAFMFALPIFTVRATIVLPSASVQWTLAGRKKPRLFSRGYVFALPIFTVRAIYRRAAETVRWTVSGAMQHPNSYKRKPQAFACGFYVCVTYFHG